MNATRLPDPAVRTRPRDDTLYRAALKSIEHPVAARVIAGRPLPTDIPLQQALRPGLGHLDHFDGLPDIDPAAERLARAVMQGETIALETDHDVDGVTSHAVLYSALVRHFGVPASHIQSYIGHRLKDGYGLSDPVADRILAAQPRPSVVITADNGSSDEPRIARLAAAGIDVIVTDHHALPQEGPSASAFACVTPARDDCRYPDPLIAGCMVSWLLSCALRRKLMDAGHIGEDAPSLGELLDYVAVGTVADCVSLARSVNNRAVVRAGLARINADRRPCWRAAHAWLHGRSLMTAEDLAFGVGPRINARGRLDEAMAGVRFLLSETGEEAAELSRLLDTENDARKDIERVMRDTALVDAAQQVDGGATGLVIWLPEGHPGVHGIVASRVVEAFGRPVVCLSPKAGNDDLVSGSARAIDGIHIREALQGCADRLGDAMIAFGGHAGAGGLTLRRDAIDAFRAAFDAEASKALGGRDLGPVVWTDGEVEAQHLNLETVDALAGLDPYGREFESPLFEGTFAVRLARAVGDGTHLRLTLQSDDACVPAIWFRARSTAEQPMPVAVGDTLRAVYRLAANTYNGNRSVQLVVERGAAVHSG